jgi:Zn-dependent protease
MTRCEVCGKDEAIPFICTYCGKSLCGEHRLPESHDCLALPKTQPTGVRGNRDLRSSRQHSQFRTSRTEILHLGIGILIFFVVAGALTTITDVGVLLIVGLGVASAFLLHELAHKLTAQHYNLWSEFRLNPMMATLSLITAFPFIPIKIIAPGAVRVFGYPITTAQMGKISIAGSSANLIQVLIFTLLSYSMPVFSSAHALFIYIAFLNAELATFNLVPISVLDGNKVLAWNKTIWALAFSSALISLIFILYA